MLRAIDDESEFEVDTLGDGEAVEVMKDFFSTRLGLKSSVNISPLSEMSRLEMFGISAIQPSRI